MDLETCCIGDLCTLVRNGIAWPIIYGIGVNVKTGDIFPAQFTDKGPDMDIRYARTLTGGDNVGVSSPAFSAKICLHHRAGNTCFLCVVHCATGNTCFIQNLFSCWKSMIAQGKS